jgi:hypothetical protein
MTVVVPHKQVAVLAELSDDQLGRVLKAGGKKSPLTGDMALLADKFGASTAWVVIATTDPSFKAGFSAGLAGNPAAKGLTDAVQSAKGLALAANLTGGQVAVQAAVLCPDAAAAQKVTDELKQSAEKSKTDLMAKAMMAMMPPAVKALQNEAESSMQFTTDGALAVMSFTLNLSTIEGMVSAFSGMAANAAPPPSPAAAQREQPGGKSGDNPRGGGGGRGRGKGKGKGGGG